MYFELETNLPSNGIAMTGCSSTDFLLRDNDNYDEVIAQFETWETSNGVTFRDAWTTLYKVEEILYWAEDCLA